MYRHGPFLSGVYTFKILSSFTKFILWSIRIFQNCFPSFTNFRVSSTCWL